MLVEPTASPVAHIDATLSISVRESFVFISWFGPPAVHTADAIFYTVKELIAEKGVCSTIMFLEKGSTPLPPEVRAHSTAQHDELSEQIDCFTILIPGTGFKASIMAILLKTMQRSTRNLWKQCIRQTQASLVDWLVENDCHKPDKEWLNTAINEHRVATLNHRGI